MKKINGTTAIVLMMSLFFANCGNDDNRTTSPEQHRDGKHPP